MSKLIFYNDEPQTVDDFIMVKVEQLLEQAVNENRKKRKIEEKVVRQYSSDFKDEMLFLGSVNDLSQFPVYTGRGVQEHAPDIQGSLADNGFTSLTLWYADVSPEEVDHYKNKLVADDFSESGNEFTKETKSVKYYIMIEYSKDTRKMRMYHTIEKIK